MTKAERSRKNWYTQDYVGEVEVRLYIKVERESRAVMGSKRPSSNPSSRYISSRHEGHVEAVPSVQRLIYTGIGDVRRSSSRRS